MSLPARIAVGTSITGRPPPRMIAVYASPWLLPPTAQHLLPGRRYPLPGPDSHRLDRASFLAH